MKNFTYKFNILICTGFLSFVFPVEAELTLCSIFSDGMVLQREKGVPVWGWADTEETVTVRFADQTATAKADADGKWKVTLSPMPASSEPRTMKITAGDQETVVNNILIGEVWLASGQSNMYWILRNCDKRAQSLLESDNLSGLRTFMVEVDHSWRPKKNVKGRWLTNDKKKELSGFSGISYFFARKLHLELGVPVGIICSAEGGSRIETWIPLEGLATEPILANYLEKRKIVRGDDPESSGLKITSMADGNCEAMTAPLVPFAMRGFIWHQGESNVRDGDAYRLKLHALIKGWRNLWNDESLYFGIGQLYAFNAPYLKTWEDRDSWVKTQFAQYQAGREIDRADCIVLSDLSTPENIHPQNKSEAGELYAVWALHDAYGFNIISGGPVIRSAIWDAEKNRVVLEFDRVGGGLKSSDGNDLKWFQFGGDNGKWIGARAHISLDRKKILLNSNFIGQIGGEVTKVRHAWNIVAMTNLVNSAGFPASVFEIDVVDDSLDSN